MTLTNKEISEKLANAIARIECLLHLGGMANDTDQVPDYLGEMLDEQGEEELKVIFPGIPDWVIESLAEYDRSDFVEWLHRNNKLGFLVQFATPVMQGGERCRTYSWGHYNTCWIYAETLAEAVEHGLKWVAERRAKEALKAAATA